jgi:hypothetical protein
VVEAGFEPGPSSSTVHALSQCREIVTATENSENNLLHFSRALTAYTYKDITVAITNLLHGCWISTTFSEALSYSSDLLTVPNIHPFTSYSDLFVDRQ